MGSRQVNGFLVRSHLMCCLVKVKFGKTALAVKVNKNHISQQLCSQEDDDCFGPTPDISIGREDVDVDGEGTTGTAATGNETPSANGFDIDGVTIMPVFIDSLNRRYHKRNKQQSR